jgi:hypothetical protein
MCVDSSGGANGAQADSAGGSPRRPPPRRSSSIQRLMAKVKEMRLRVASKLGGWSWRGWWQEGDGSSAQQHTAAEHYVIEVVAPLELYSACGQCHGSTWWPDWPCSAP